MIKPSELKFYLAVEIVNGAVSDTNHVWEILSASYEGNVDKVKQLVSECPELAYAQYNYAPPIHFAVREGHLDLVDYLLSLGAYDPKYKTYPFLDNLVAIADERGYLDIRARLQEYATDPAKQKMGRDNGEIHYIRTEAGKAFEEAVDRNDLIKVKEILQEYPELALDETFFWGEGILMMPVKEGQSPMIDQLMQYGAKVPEILKWTQAYYFETYEHAVYIMEKGMNPNTRSWHEVTILHDVAQKGNVQKAELLLKYGADIDPIDDEYQSTPLGLAARWGHLEMVEFLLSRGADPRKSGAAWSTPLSWALKKGYTEIEKILRNALV